MLLFFGGIDMAYKKQKNVNIDALIAREDFEAADETTNTASKISTLSVNDLKEGSGFDCSRHNLAHRYRQYT